MSTSGFDKKNFFVNREMEEAGDIKRPIFRDIRRYFCNYCGICRSKKSLIASHMLTRHKVCPFPILFSSSLMCAYLFSPYFSPSLNVLCYS